MSTELDTPQVMNEKAHSVIDYEPETVDAIIVIVSRGDMSGCYVAGKRGVLAHLLHSAFDEMPELAEVVASGLTQHVMCAMKRRGETG